MPYANKDDYKKWYAANRERMIAKARAWEMAPAETAQKKREYLERHRSAGRRQTTSGRGTRSACGKSCEKAEGKRRTAGTGKSNCEKPTATRWQIALLRRVLAQRTGMKGSELPQTLVDAYRGDATEKGDK